MLGSGMIYIHTVEFICTIKKDRVRMQKLAQKSCQANRRQAQGCVRKCANHRANNADVP